MLQYFFRPGLVFAAALFFTMPASIGSALAAFTLPDQARIAVTAFEVPAVSAADEAERDFAGTLRNRMVFALQKEGFTIVSPGEHGGQTPVKEAAPPHTKAPQPSPVAVAPEAAPEPAPKPGPEQAQPVESAASETAGEPPVREVEAGTEVLAGPDAARETSRVASAVLDAEKETALAPVEEGPAKEASAEEGQAESAKAPAEETRAQKDLAPLGPEYILRGRVTLLREKVGSPARIGGDIRIRTESMLHCAYTVEDALTGYVLVSDVASGSSAKIVGPANDIDDALHDLTDKVMASAAQTIAARLSGSLAVTTDTGSDRTEYQDSPGKRLKPRAKNK